MNISKLLYACFMLGIASAIPAQAQTCPCDFTLSAHEINRTLFGCTSTTLPLEDWAGARKFTVFKSRKGEYSDLVKNFQITDRAGGSEPDTHICGTYSRWGRDGSPRNKVESTIVSIEDWHACRADLSVFALALANPDTDPFNTCDPSRDDTSLPDRYEYVGSGGQERAFPPPPDF